MNYENLIVETEGRIAVVKLNRPKALNALNKDLIADINSFLIDAKDNKDIGVIILTGEGGKAFVAGADIKEFTSLDENQGQELAKKGHDLVFNVIENYPKPIIAAINGFALGGGLELALACHFRLASENAKMGLPEVTLGLVPGYGGTQRLPKAIGKGRAMQMILSAEMINAEIAERYGLVNKVTSATELIEECKKIASKILRNAPNAVEKAISLVNVAGEKNGFEKEISSFGSLFKHENLKEGVQAFVEKRAAKFKID